MLSFRTFERPCKASYIWRVAISSISRSVMINMLVSVENLKRCLSKCRFHTNNNKYQYQHNLYSYYKIHRQYLDCVSNKYCCHSHDKSHDHNRDFDLPSLIVYCPVCGCVPGCLPSWSGIFHGADLDEIVYGEVYGSQSNSPNTR